MVDDKGDFRVCAYVEPDMNSFGWAFEPPAREGKFRLRAFRWGEPSNVVSATTGADEDSDSPQRAR